MNRHRAELEATFLRICRDRGPAWIESIIRPLHLSGANVRVRDIPLGALEAIVGVFSGQERPVHRIPAR